MQSSSCTFTIQSSSGAVIKRLFGTYENVFRLLYVVPLRMCISWCCLSQCILLPRLLPCIQGATCLCVNLFSSTTSDVFTLSHLLPYYSLRYFLCTNPVSKTTSHVLILSQFGTLLQDGICVCVNPFNSNTYDAVILSRLQPY